MHEQPNGQMQWAVLALSGFVLVVSVVVSFFRKDTDTNAAYYLFGTVAALVFGATAINKIKK